MDANDSLNNFDYEGFMAREFPMPKGKYPDIERSFEHLNKITKLLLDSARQSLKVAEGNDRESARHANTRAIIVSNYRLRTINLIKIFSEILDLKGDPIFDEGTANIVGRSMLESYLVYFRLYNGCERDKEMQELYFSLYDLSSTLHFAKFGRSLYGLGQHPFDEENFKQQIEKLTIAIRSNKRFRKLPTGTRNAIQKIEDGEQDYLSFINFNRLIKESPLPTHFTSIFYSYSSSFAHSEGFSSRVSQVYFESREKWTELKEMLKFRLIYVCLAISSQFFMSYVEYDKTELKDENDVRETYLLCKYYLEALRHNQ